MKSFLSRLRLTRVLAHSKILQNSRNHYSTTAHKPRILLTGGLGQIGQELIPVLRQRYGQDNVISSDVHRLRVQDRKGPYFFCNILDKENLERLVVENDVDWIIHNASILSAAGERNPALAMDVNITGLHNVLDVAYRHKLRVFAPSSIAAFGPSTPPDNTPDLTIMRPVTIYGVSKVYAELLGEYYHKKFGLDFRSLRYPGILSYVAPPGGGTTDYAVDIYYKAILEKKFTCFLSEKTMLPMMYMPDCIKGTISLLEAPSEQLTQRTYNLAAISFTPEELARSIQAHIPEFQIDYAPDFRQHIADSWPNSFDDSKARQDWGWRHDYDMEAITKDMLYQLRKKLL